MASANFLLIEQAIKTKSQIHADYQVYHREMCPHMLGYKNEIEEHTLFVQFGGRTSKGFINPQNSEWKCMKVSELRNVQIINGPFYNAEDDNRKNSSCVDRIISVVN